MHKEFALPRFDYSTTENEWNSYRLQDAYGTGSHSSKSQVLNVVISLLGRRFQVLQLLQNLGIILLQVKFQRGGLLGIRSQHCVSVGHWC